MRIPREPLTRTTSPAPTRARSAWIASWTDSTCETWLAGNPARGASSAIQPARGPTGSRPAAPRAPRARPRPQAQLGARRLQADQDLLPGQAFGQADGRRPQRGVHRVLAEQRHADVFVLASVMQRKANAVQTETDDPVGPQV